GGGGVGCGGSGLDAVFGGIRLGGIHGERLDIPGRNAFFVSAYSTSSMDGNIAVEAELRQAGLTVQDNLAASLVPGEIAFVDAGVVDHNDFVTSAWGGAPLRDVFSRIR
ncbi:MAG: hypothetical protein ACLP0Q_04680, partial [Rhodoblastus sp.]